jgi:hypothetical protein
VTTPGYEGWKTSFQLSPIVLVSGAAAPIPGAQTPIIAYTQPGGLFNDGGGEVTDDNFFAAFEPMPGGTLIENEVSTYPFANQTIAANAIITQPLRISLRMVAPVRGPGGYQQKLAIFKNLQTTLQAHILAGGWFNVVTPACFYTNCLLTALRDVGSGESRQPQIVWQWDFMQPLLTLAQAAQQYSASMGKIAQRVQITGDPPPTSGASPNVGSTAGSVASSVLNSEDLAAMAFSGIPAVSGVGLSGFASSVTTGLIGPGFSTP